MPFVPSKDLSLIEEIYTAAEERPSIEEIQQKVQTYRQGAAAKAASPDREPLSETEKEVLTFRHEYNQAKRIEKDLDLISPLGSTGPTPKTVTTEKYFQSDLFNRVRSNLSVIANGLGEPPPGMNLHRAHVAKAHAAAASTGDPRAIDILNFLIGGELGTLGFELDQNGLRWSIDKLQLEWSQHPVMSGITLAGLVAGLVFPTGAAFSKSLRVGKIAQFATKYPKTVGKLLGKYSLLPAASHAQIVRKMALQSLDASDDPLLKHFQPKTAAKILSMTDEEIVDQFPFSHIQNRLLSEHSIRKAREVMERVEMDPESATITDRAFYLLHKNFANRYFQLPSSFSHKYVVDLNKVYEEQNIGELIASMPGSEMTHKFIFSYLLDDNPTKGWQTFVDSMTRLYKNKLIPRGEYENAIRFTHSLGTHLATLQNQMYKEGFLFGGEIKKVGAFHIPISYRSSDFFSPEVVQKHLEVIPPSMKAKIRKSPSLAKSILGQFKIPELFGPGILPRRIDKSTVFKQLLDDNVADTPEYMVVSGLLKDHLYFESYKLVRDLSIAALKGDPSVSKFIRSKEEIMKLSESARRFWISLDDIPNLARSEPLYAHIQESIAQRLRNMISRKLGGEVKDLPYINIRVFEELFGERGMLSQAQHMPTMIEMLFTVHKISQTVLNPASHGNNLVGNLAFLSMAGVNIFKPSFWAKWRDSSEFFYRVTQFIKGNPHPFAFREAFKPTNVAAFLGKKAKMISRYGDEIDLVEVFSNPQVRLILDESAFEAAEGYIHFRREAEKLAQLDPAQLRPMRDNLVKMISNISKLPGIEQTLDNASALYLAEDVVPKTAFLLELLEEGWTLEAAILEVGRRTPQYATLGRSITPLRKLFIPWISFPAEAARIMKNNIMDFPFRMLPWLLAPRILQTIAAEVGLAPPLEELPEIQKSFKRWAIKPTSVILGNEAAGVLSGGLAMGGIAAGLGGAIGGPRTALGLGVAGMLLGSSLGELAYNLDANIRDPGEDFRSWVMDFIPYSALVPTTTHPVLLEGPVSASDLYELSPVQPLSIIKDMVDIATGQTPFGTEMPSTSALSPITKTALGLVALISPTWIQKYGMRFTEPKGNFLPVEAMFGRDIKVPQEVITAASAAVGAGLGYAGLGVPGAIGTGLLFGLAGQEMGLQRLMVDAGLKEDPMTGKPGNPIYDILFSTFVGGAKNYGMSPEVALVNEAFRQKKYERVRGSLMKRFRDEIAVNDLEGAAVTLREIKASFNAQFLDPERSALSFEKWVLDNYDTISQHPQLKPLSKEDLAVALRRATEIYRKTGSAYMKQLIAAIRKEMFSRAAAIEFDPNTGTYLIPKPTVTKEKLRKRREKRSEKKLKEPKIPSAPIRER